MFLYQLLQMKLNIQGGILIKKLLLIGSMISLLLISYLIIVEFNNTKNPVTNALVSLTAKVTKEKNQDELNNNPSLDKPTTIFNEKEKEMYSGWELIWSDEFDTESIDSKIWNIVETPPFKNSELQYYLPKNVHVKDDYLILSSQNQSYKDSLYTSGAINTKGKLELQYGKIEVRARLPRGKGIFPAIWLLSAKNDYLPEIDIMEMLGDEPTKIWMVYHWQAENIMRKFAYYEGPDFTQDFHIYSVEWDESGIRWLINNDLKFQIDVSPSEPLYLYINTAVGGIWPGSPDQSTSFPQHFVVDYVRVFKNFN